MVIEAPEAPTEYAGRWIAWNEDHTEVIADGETMIEARENAIKTGTQHFGLYKVPDKDIFYGGAALFR